MKKILICFLFVTGFSFAQEPVELRLAEAASYALEHKAEAEKARLDIANADARIAEVRANALPNISASAATTYNPLLQQNGKKIEYDHSRVALNNLLTNRQQAINAVELSENFLKFMIGMSIAQKIALPEQNFQPALLPRTDLKKSDRTEIELVEKRIELLELQKRSTLAEYYPSVSLVGNYGWLGQGDVIPLKWQEILN